MRLSRSESPEDKISLSMRWKVAAGIGLTGILLLQYAGYFGSGNFIFGPALLFAALYGWVSRDFKLSVIFGVLFFLALPCVLFLRTHDVPPPSVLPFFLLWGLVTPLMGVIWA